MGPLVLCHVMDVVLQGLKSPIGAITDHPGYLKRIDLSFFGECAHRDSIPRLPWIMDAEIAHVAIGVMVAIVSRCVARRYNNQPLEVVVKS